MIRETKGLLGLLDRVDGRAELRLQKLQLPLQDSQLLVQIGQLAPS